MKKEIKSKLIVIALTLIFIVGLGNSLMSSPVYGKTMITPIPGCTWDQDSKTLTLNGIGFSDNKDVPDEPIILLDDPTIANTDAAIMLPDDSTIILADGSSNSINYSGGNGIFCEGDLK